jgi:competence protein ComFC
VTHSLLKILSATGRNIWNAVNPKDIVFPRVCPACLLTSKNGAELCTQCSDDLEYIIAPRCHGCGGNINGVLELCQECLSNPRPWQRGYSAFSFTGLARRLIHRFKYQGDVALSRMLAVNAIEVWARETEISYYQHVVPVPLHWYKKLRRGYNQSEVLAREFCRMTDIPYSNALQRIKWTTSQARLTRQKRKQNLKNAFSVKKSTDLLHANILLVDDVFTTGLTLTACSKALNAAGCKRVDVLTIARSLG